MEERGAENGAVFVISLPAEGMEFNREVVYNRTLKERDI